MEIVDLSERHHPSYLACLEEWSEEMAEAGDHKSRWYRKMRDRGLRVKLALDDDGREVGMIQYLPIEHALALGEDLYMILCVWVHGYPQGVGDQQGHGIGAALLAAAEKDSIELGAKGMAAWGVLMPFWMKASWFKKHGYQKADRSGIRMLLWKPFTEDAQAPRWIEDGPTPKRVPDQVSVMAFMNGWCPASNLVYERAKRAANELGDDVVFESIDTSERADLLRYGHSDEVFLDGKRLQHGPPPSYERVYAAMAKRLGRLRK
jgi:GNAT superfamily N-acetyltransferase